MTCVLCGRKLKSGDTYVFSSVTRNHGCMRCVVNIGRPKGEK